MKIAAGLTEDDVVVGNTYDKYGTRNPVVRHLMAGFERNLSELLAVASPGTIHEVGCGEGYWVTRWTRSGMAARGSDFSSAVINLARANASAAGLSGDIFSVRSIYELEEGRDAADLVVCCEVMEHLDEPKRALAKLQDVVSDHLILSVPREPLWRALNMARGKYIAALGNTPGHVQHWSRSGFIHLVEQYFDVIEARTPLPWTMLLCRPKK